MKKLAVTFTLIAAFGLAAGTLAKAQILTSVNFQGGDTVGLASGDTTGVLASANWNNITGASGSSIALNKSDGTNSGLTLTTFSTSNGLNGPDNSNTTPQETLFSGSLAVNFGPGTFTIGGLSQYSSYNLIVYYTMGTSFPDTRDTNFTASGSALTYYATGISSVYTAFTQSNSTDSSTYASGNYVEFDGLTAPTETVVMNYVNNNVGLVGFQISGISAVPEPSTWMLMFGGLLLLMSVQRFRRQSFQA